MVLGIILILVIALVAFFHYIQGFFSAAISAIITIIAALLSIGWHENIIAMMKPGKFADSASAMVLCTLFAVIYVLLRVIFDKAVPGNVRVKPTIDKIGAALMGVVAGIFATGVAAIALQTMALGPSVGGYARYALGTDREVRVPSAEGKSLDRKVYDEMKNPRFDSADLSKLILPVDDIVVGVAASASSGCLSGGQPLTSVHPDWLQELFGQRLGMETGSKRTANNLVPSTPEITVPAMYFFSSPSGVVDAELYEVRGEKRAALATESKPAEVQKEGPLAGQFKQLLISKKQLLVVRVHVDHNATDGDSIFRVSPGAVRLLVKTSEGAKDYYPVGTVDEDGKVFVNRVDDYIFAASQDDLSIDFIFDVAPDDVADPAAPGKTERQVKPGTLLVVKQFGQVDLTEAGSSPGLITAGQPKRPENAKDPVLRKFLIKKPPAPKEGT